ncbi:MAG: NADPH-dependent FMN reductase [Nevskia sp.]
MLKVLAFAGTQRSASYNRKLVRIAARGVEAAGIEIVHLDWADYAMPLYDPELEARGMPEAVLRFKALLIAHQGFLISSPEYNGSMSPLMKNSIDWATRPVPGEKPMACFKHKVVGLLSTSPGVFGGVLGLVQVRALLTRLGCLVIPEQYPVGEAGKIFDEQGELRDPKHQAIAESIGARLAAVLKHWPEAQA